ncbi:MAG: hypothetical protein KKB50_03030 [Planctomycetes bacterium]|nr:hypothetical protein [Planctomycetota bacterium]
MKKTATTIRCVPRCGYDDTRMRVVDVSLVEPDDEQNLSDALELWFAQRGIPNAVYGIDIDDDGYIAIINDEAFAEEWGTPVF